MGSSSCLSLLLLCVEVSWRIETDKIGVSGKDCLPHLLLIFGVAGGLGGDSSLRFMLVMLVRFSLSQWSMLIWSVMMIMLRWDWLVSEIMLWW